MEISLNNLKQSLSLDLKKQAVSPKIFMSRFRVISEASRQTSAYEDPRYIPFYYHLGKYVKPKNMMEIGFRLGLLTATFLKSCKETSYVLAFQPRIDEFYSFKLGETNVRDSYKGELETYYGDFYDKELEKKIDKRKFDLVIINDETKYDMQLAYLESMWSKMNLGGFIVVEYYNFHKPSKDALDTFCKVKNREIIMFSTRYGAGIIQK